MYRFLFRYLLFALPPEWAHRWVLAFVGCLCRLPGLRYLLRWIFGGSNKGLATSCWDLCFPNPVGLAAGMDKDGKYLWMWWVLGFGFVEVGTVTPRPQLGNPRPRLFRLPREEALLNRMGFNNLGAEALKRRLRRRPPSMLLGINIGKQKETPLGSASADYLSCLKDLYEMGDYFVINVSSPNTEGLRQLQSADALAKLVEPLIRFRDRQLLVKPLLLKISPDLNEKELQEIVTTSKEIGISGLVATNTRPQQRDLPRGSISGGLSGGPLRRRSAEVLAFLAQQPDPLPLIGVGGILSPEDALQRKSAGACLVQLYTGLVYAGPFLPRAIKRAFCRMNA